MRRPRPTGVVILSLLAAGCAQRPTDPAARADYDRANDPAEPTNRAIFGANQYIDRNALRPVARTYAASVPKPMRGGIHDFGSNLHEPGVAINDVLQANFERAATTTGRFLVNTTVGLAGIFDVASGWGMPYHDADFGQTLGVWGAGPGPAVQLPLFGPSNVRDSVGQIVGGLADPLNFVTGGAVTAIQLVSGGASAVDGRARLLPTTDALQRTSLDYYATLRSLSAQRRAALVAEGRSGGEPGRVDKAPTSQEALR